MRKNGGCIHYQCMPFVHALIMDAEPPKSTIKHIPYATRPVRAVLRSRIERVKSGLE